MPQAPAMGAFFAVGQVEGLLLKDLFMVWTPELADDLQLIPTRPQRTQRRHIRVQSGLQSTSASQKRGRRYTTESGSSANEASPATPLDGCDE